jgi:hypothetical protein
LENKKCCGSGNNAANAKRIKAKAKIRIINKSSSSPEKEKSCCCGGSEKCSTEPITQYNKNCHWIIGEVKTEAGMAPRVSTQLVFSDTCGAWKARWGINK